MALCALYAATDTPSSEELCPTSPKLVFITSRSYPATLGGLTGRPEWTER